MVAFQITLAIVAIALTAWIAWRQWIHLKKLKQILEETADTAEQLKTDSYTQKVVKSFFSAGPAGQKKYKCVFPVVYDRRPLPSIFAGDYYALQVLQNLLGSDRLKPKPITQDPDPTTADNLYAELATGNVIYLCSPSSNPALDKLAEAVDITDRTIEHKPTFSGIDLPCWFALDDGPMVGGSPSPPTKKIWVSGIEQGIISPAEDDYVRARTLPPGAVYVPLGPLQSDYGILMRLSVGGRKVIVMAGIHQYGTWIVGEFFRRIAAQEEGEYKKIFTGNDDFAAVIWGNYDPKQFSVTDCGVEKHFLWVRRSGQWKVASI